MTTPDLAVQAAERIAERCLSKLGLDWREEVSLKDMEELVDIIRSFFANAETLAAAAEAKMAQAKQACRRLIEQNLCWGHAEAARQVLEAMGEQP